MSDGPRAVAESYWRDESARNIDAVLDHFHPDAELWAPGGHRVGHAEIRAYYEDSARAYPGLWVEIIDELVVGDRATLEWRAELTDTAGQRYRASGANVVEVRDGKFVYVHSYFDTRPLV